jgi:predicted glycosyltransferase
MDTLGLLRAIHPDQLTPALLQNEILRLLENNGRYLSSLNEFDMNGLGNVADASLQLIPGLNTFVEPANTYKAAAGY